MKSWITSAQVTKLLDDLYADSAKNDPLIFQAAEAAGASHANDAEFYTAVNKAYMAIGPDFGRLLYAVIRGARAKTVVEFGTSFGVSTIYLASAVRDNGTGKVITSEFDPGKVARAKKNLAAAGLEEWVEFRSGDALKTLADVSGEIDLLFLDGPKGMYIDVLKMLEPKLRSGSIVASDNTDHEGMESFLEYIRNPGNGYTSAAISTLRGERSGGHEITLRD